MKSLRTLPFVFYFISLFSLKVYSASSDSLYLVRTFQGNSFENGALNTWGGLGDINHDGKDDFVISYCSDYWGDKHHSGYAELYLGCDDLVNIKPSYVFKNCDFINPIGDVNNDGFDDFLVAEFDSAYSPYLMDKFKVYFGNNQMFDTIPKFTFRPSYGWMIYFIYTEKLGDINGDGYDDFAISTPYNWSNGYGKVYVFLGGKTLDEKPALILEDPFKSDKVHNSFGDGVAGIGDVNNDGYKDFIVSSCRAETSRVFLYYGGSKLSNQPAKILLDPEKGGVSFGLEIKNAGDINKGGKDEFIITDDHNVYIYLGLDSIKVIHGLNFGGTGYVGAGVGGDVNGDGYNDFLVSNTNHLNSAGVMVGETVFFNGSADIDTVGDIFLEGTKKWLEYGKYTKIIGDINGDGFAEVLVDENSWPDYEHDYGRLHLLSHKNLTGIDDKNKGHISPSDYKLFQNYPNPFNPETVIRYRIPEPGKVTIKIYDLMGIEVSEPVNEYKAKGEYSFVFKAGRLSSGTYICRIKVNNFTQAQKMQLIK